MRPLLASLACWLLSAWAGTAHAQTAQVTMSASASEVLVGEPFAVMVRIDSSHGEPDSVTLPDFGKLEVLGKQVSRPLSFSFSFGGGGQHAVRQSHIVYTFRLRALEPGSYEIEPTKITTHGRKHKSQSLTITARGDAIAPSMPQGDPMGTAGTDEPGPPDNPLDGATYDPDAFLRTVVDKRTPYVGEQVTVTVYLYVRGSLSQNPVLTREPTTEGFWVQDLLPTQRTLSPTQQEVKGRTFNAYVLRRFAAFPMRAGSLHIGAPELEVGGGASIFDLLTGPSAPTRRKGREVTVEARALPPAPGRGAIYTGQLSLEAKLDAPSAQVGDAVTLTVVARGSGNLRALELPPPVLDGLEVLDPETRDEVTTDLNLVGGTRTFRYLVLPRTAGKRTIPSISVRAFDPSAGRYTTASTEPIELEVTGTSQPAVQAPASEDTTHDAEQPPRFGPARRQSALTRRTTPLYREAWYIPALLLGPALLSLVVISRYARRRWQAREDRGSAGRTLREARARLVEASEAAEAGDARATLGAVVQALKRALEARLDEPVGGLTRDALRKHLVTRGMGAPLAERVVAQLEAAELGRFDPLGKSRAELETALEKARGLVRELEHFSPRMEAPK